MEKQTLKQWLTEIDDQIQAMRKELKKGGQGRVKEEFREFFEKHPKILGFRWHQYTPSFNDGDACEFSISEYSFKLDDAEDEDTFEDSYGFKGEDAKAVEKAEKALDWLSTEAAQSMLEQVFGNGVQVTVTPKGIDVEDSDYGY